MLRIVVAGALATPAGHGGMAWSVLQYVLGLRRLGHDVVLVEPVQSTGLIPAADSLAASVHAQYLADVARRYGLEDRWAMLLLGTSETVGLSYEALLAFARDADLVLNLSGLLTDPALLGLTPVRVYLDLDPGFTQVWQAVADADLRLAGHTHYVTLAQDLGEPGCPIPTLGLPWLSTVPPVVLEQWPTGAPIARHALTTVGSWRSYGSIEYEGRVYGQKVHAVRPLIDLPRRVSVPIQVAFGIHPEEQADLAALAAGGWGLLDPTAVAGTPDAYRAFVQGSWAELGIAKSGYVAAGCGWFSDRSVCYLASGRPVVALDTGFGAYLPTGLGLLAFATLDEAVAAIEAIAGDYERHSTAARELAEASFDSDRVLARLLDRVFSQGPADP